MPALSSSLSAVKCALLAAFALGAWQTCDAQTALTWAQLKEKFEAGNPTLQAAEAGIAESKANEVTAYMRPNPGVTGGLDQIDPFGTPFQGTTSTGR